MSEVLHLCWLSDICLCTILSITDYTCRLIFKSLREKMGLDRCRIMGSAAAPIARSVLEFFLDFDMPIYELYGMSESSGPQTISLIGQFSLIYPPSGQVFPCLRITTSNGGLVICVSECTRGNYRQRRQEGLSHF